MSANKLLKRVVSPVEEEEDGGDAHEYTYGIVSFICGLLVLPLLFLSFLIFCCFLLLDVKSFDPVCPMVRLPF